MKNNDRYYLGIIVGEDFMRYSRGNSRDIIQLVRSIVHNTKGECMLDSLESSNGGLEELADELKRIVKIKQGVCSIAGESKKRYS